MKIKLTATLLLCSLLILCSELSAASPLGQLLQSGSRSIEAAAPVAVNSQNMATPVPVAVSSQDVGVSAPMVENSCGCEATMAEGCGCEAAAPVCGCRRRSGLKGLLERMAGQVPGDCDCGPTCEPPAPPVAPPCDCAPAPSPSCGCDEAPAPSCGLLNRLTARSGGGCGCDEAPAPSCGCQNGGLLSRLTCLLYTSPSPRDLSTSRMPSSA